MTSEFARLTFAEAAPLWLASRTQKLNPSTVDDYKHMIGIMKPFFGNRPLNSIHLGHIVEYQKLRLETAGPSRINHEISCLGQVMKRANLWSEIEAFYESLPLPKNGPGIALEPEEEAYLFKIAKKKRRWFVAYCCAIISNTTTAGPSEIRNLRLGDIDLGRKLINIRQGVKNDFRPRPIPLCDDAFWAVTQLLERAQSLGASDSEHYLLPHRAREIGSKPDPTRPAGSWRRAWESMRKEAGKVYPRLLKVRFYDLRHTSATKLMEDPRVSEYVIEELMGHRVKSETKKIYSHVRMDPKRLAVSALDMGLTKNKPAPRSEKQPVLVRETRPTQMWQSSSFTWGMFKG